MYSVKHEWDYEPDPHMRERDGAAVLTVTVERTRPKRSLYWRFLDAYFNALFWVVKFLVQCVLAALVLGCVWFIAVLVRLMLQ